MSETQSRSSATSLGPRDDGRIGDWLQGHGGSRLYPFDIRPEDFDINVIAHALARINRWNGHTREPISVAQHSFFVSNACHPENALWGLLHDACEAWIGDCPKPIKVQPFMEPYRQAEARGLAVMCLVYGLHPEMPDDVKAADDACCATEAAQLFDRIDPEWFDKWVRDAPKLDIKIRPWSAEHSERMFLARFHQLQKLRSQ